MNESAFDPYYRWLGIPVAQQPPHHYRLLGIDVFESDVEVIQIAAERQIRHIRGFATGEYKNQANELLNALARAEAVLSNTEKKARYDEELRDKLKLSSESKVVANPPLPTSTPPEPEQPHDDTDKSRQSEQSSESANTSKPDKPTSTEERVEGEELPNIESQHSLPKNSRSTGWASFSSMASKGFLVACFLVVLGGVGWYINNGGSDSKKQLVQNKNDLKETDGLPVLQNPPTPDLDVDQEKIEDDVIAVNPEELRELERKLTENKKWTVKPQELGLQTPGKEIRYKLVDAPKGVLVNKRTGEVTWTPPEDAESCKFSLRVVNTRNKDTLVDGCVLSIAIEEVNSPPVLSKVPQQSAALMTPWILKLEIKDPDIPRTKFILKTTNDRNLRFFVDEETHEIGFLPTSESGLKPGDIINVNVTVDDNTYVEATDFQIKLSDSPAVINSANMQLMPIPTGEFLIGGSNYRRVVFTRPILLLESEVTQFQYNSVMRRNPSYFIGDLDNKNPVENMTWEQANEFCQKLSELDGKFNYRLPTVDEWQFACRACTTTRFHFGSQLTTKQARIGETKPAPIKRFPPNAFGLFDMHGNVAEWCAPDTFESEARPLCGGDFGRRSSNTRASWFVETRTNGVSAKSFGFRIVREPEVEFEPMEKPPLFYRMSPQMVQDLVAKCTSRWKMESGMKGAYGMKFVSIPPATTYLGVVEEQNTLPATVDAPFWMGITEVTQEQYSQLMQRQPSYFSNSGPGKSSIGSRETNRMPVENLTWDEAVEYCQKLTEKEKLLGFVYRLPTEVEWEYACRGNRNTRYGFGNEVTKIQAHFRQSKDKGPSFPRDVGPLERLGSSVANAFGLKDMHGNVQEWCSDQIRGVAFSANTMSPDFVDREDTAVARGGSFRSLVKNVSAIYRSPMPKNTRNNWTGFRVVMERIEFDTDGISNFDQLRNLVGYTKPEK